MADNKTTERNPQSGQSGNTGQSGQPQQGQQGSNQPGNNRPSERENQGNR